ncbi:MAG: UDP-2,4-diacetamido-2,4,6-trideoxy-beta-L-altropyranose hydrolase [Lachnospiraceae bacterium]|nr:UDP-2,4-diacetamido-2,4,6-trideoxy-beta-L-altropyranose hydrolase [Lachnospiraceae bacterium]
MIGIRADGNNQIGIGHVMRCLTIAEALRENGAKVVFLTADDSCGELIRERGFVCRNLNSDFADMDSELEKLCPVMDEMQIERLLVDSYYVTKTYLETIRQHARIIYLDDVDSFPYPVDLLINYNVFAKTTDYPYGVEYIPDGIHRTRYEKETITGIMAGPQFAPVRKEFAGHPMEVRKKVDHILITSGGSDAYNLSFKIANTLLQCTDAVLHIVCGPFNLHKNKLLMLAETKPRVVVHQNVKDMWNLMQNCDMAVSAAGSTMCELSAAGVPSVTFSFVENQRKIAETFGMKNAAMWVGHYVPEEEDIFLTAVAEATEKMCACEDLRKELSRKANHLVDGQGAKRIAEAILNCSQDI